MHKKLKALHAWYLLENQRASSSHCDLPASVSVVDPPDFATCIETKDGNFGCGVKFRGCEKN